MYYGAKFVFESWNRCSSPTGLAYPLNPQVKSMTIKTSRFWNAQKNRDENFFLCLALGKGAISISAAFSLCISLYIDLSCFVVSAQGLKN